MLRLKCTKFDFGWGSAPNHAGGPYSAPPDPIAGFGGRFAAGGRGWGRGGKGGGEGEGEVERRERDGPQVTVEPGPLTALLRHALDVRQKHRLMPLLSGRCPHNNSTHIIYVYYTHSPAQRRAAVTAAYGQQSDSVGVMLQSRACGSSLGGCPLELFAIKCLSRSLVFCWHEIPGTPNSLNQAHPRRLGLATTWWRPITPPPYGAVIKSRKTPNLA